MYWWWLHGTEPLECVVAYRPVSFNKSQNEMVEFYCFYSLSFRHLEILRFVIVMTIILGIIMSFFKHVSETDQVSKMYCFRKLMTVDSVQNKGGRNQFIVGLGSSVHVKFYNSGVPLCNTDNHFNCGHYQYFSKGGQPETLLSNEYANQSEYFYKSYQSSEFVY